MRKLEGWFGGFGGTHCAGSHEWKDSELATGGNDEEDSGNINPHMVLGQKSL